MSTENLPISGLYPLEGSLTPNDLMAISQEKVEGWKSYNVPVSKFVDLVIEGMNDGSVFLRKVYTLENSGMVGTGVLTDALGLDWTLLESRFAPANVGAAYVPSTRRIIAGNGLVGGGALDTDRTMVLGTPSTITGSTTNVVSAESHTHAIDKASTSVAGVVRLIDTLTSSSVTDAATARTVKALNDAKAEKSVNIVAGNGLTGGGDLSESRTVTLGVPSDITETSTNLLTATSHTHAVSKASTSAAGIVKLNDTLTSVSVTEAATARQAKLLNDSKADKSITLTMGWGLTGGGNLTANRTIDLNLAQLDTRYAASGVGGSYVPLTRTLTAGAGLTGGGDLSTNRSFSVVYGTAAGTVAQGNDSRINNGQTAFGWGNHGAQGYIKTVALRASSGLVGTGINTTNGLGLDYNTIDARYVKTTGGVINGDLTVNGKITSPSLDQGIPIGTIQWFNCPRNTIPDGWVALDGQLVNRADFPDLWAMINANRLNRVTDTLWLTFPTNADSILTNRLNYRSCFTPGDGSTTFRMADLNGKTTGSLKSPVLRGDGYNVGGQMLGDAIRNITGTVGNFRTDNVGYRNFAGAFSLGSNATSWNGNLNVAGTTLILDTSLVVPTATENRPNSAFGVYAIKARGGTSTIPASGSPATLLANTFNGSQKIAGDLEVTGNLTVGGKINLSTTSLNGLPFIGAGQETKIFIAKDYLNDARTVRLSVDTGERRYDTLYTNTTDKPRLIHVFGAFGDATVRLGSKRFRIYDGYSGFTWIIKPGETYGIFNGGVAHHHILSWIETV